MSIHLMQYVDFSTNSCHCNRAICRQTN